MYSLYHTTFWCLIEGELGTVGVPGKKHQNLISGRVRINGGDGG